MKALTLLAISALSVGCSVLPPPCPSASVRLSALLGLRDRDWSTLHEADVVPHWPVLLQREEGAYSTDSAGNRLPSSSFVYVASGSSKICRCCDAVEFEALPSNEPHLAIVTLHLSATSREAAVGLAQAFIVGGIPTRFAPEPKKEGWVVSAVSFPWSKSYTWQSEGTRPHETLEGMSEVQVDREHGTWLVFVRHVRILVPTF